MTRSHPSLPASTPCAGRAWSCDTFAVHAPHTRYQATLLGKNSDRPARESQPLRWLEARRGGGTVKLAYVEIDDVSETIPHLGSSPYWCWGHEIGVNAAGVAIGNEALFTRDVAATAATDRAGHDVGTGILGMELVRLGLERGHTAREAVQVMTELLERHGQYGAGTASSDRPSAAYDNSYLVADASDVWVLETTGHRWVTKQITSSCWALSNEPTLRDDWDAGAPDLAEHAQRNGWAGPVDRLDFAATFLDPTVPLQVSHLRLQRSRQLLADAIAAGGVGFPESRRLLSDHYEGTFLGGPMFNPARPDFHTLCMHEHPSGFTWGNTAASMIAVLPAAGRPYIWWAATTPCTSIYIPVALTGASLPAALGTAGTQHGTGPHPEQVAGDGSATGSYWWTFQNLLEAIAGDTDGSQYLQRQPLARAQFDELQEQWLKQVEDLATHGTDEDWQKLTAHCVATAQSTAEALTSAFRNR